jgi:hypothetical protein
MRSLTLAVAAALACAPAVHAQRAGRVEGDVTDSLHSRPLAGAVVLLSSLAPGSSAFYSATADDRGRFRFDSVDAGRYSVSLSHAILDSLELALPPQEVAVTAGERARIALALPSGATLRARSCPGIVIPATRGAVVGQVNDADREQPMAGTTISLEWMDVVFDRRTLRSDLTPRSASVRTDSTGVFRFCGVPTDTYLLLQVQREERAGAVVRISVPEASGLTVLRLSYSVEGSRPLSAFSDSTREESLPPLTGTASVTGVVHTANGQPLANALVRVADAAAESRTDTKGAFTLGALPAGTQVLEVRRVGFLVSHERVELRAGRTETVDVLLQRIVTLDSVHVLAQRNRYRETAERQRRQGGAATYVTQEQIDRIKAPDTGDLVARLGMLRLSGTGLDAKVFVQRGSITIIGPPCPANIVVDGFQHQDVNIVRPEEIGMIEIYTGPAGAPVEYDSACGVVVIWTKR